jgi:putative Mg2+ transporter-C (MgtC) family protein
MDWLEVALRLSLATGAGMLIGIDRELQHKAAGLRTHMLVSLGAASAMLIALQLDANPSRVVQGVVTGIGFIGAGAILHSARHIEARPPSDAVMSTRPRLWPVSLS